MACEAVGRVVSFGGAGLTVPEPGMGVSVDGLAVSGGPEHFQLEVSADGFITYPGQYETRKAVESATSLKSSDPNACADAAYSIYDYVERDAYVWHIGDGGMPGALSRSAAQIAFLDAINNITDSYNDCGLTDDVSVSQRYSGTTSYEGDYARGSLTCTERDKVSTWDAGDLNSNVLAGACVWYAIVDGVPADVIEADVRYNTADFDFTNNPRRETCKNKYDMRAVGTHEAGHIFGLAHVSDGHSDLTMYTNSFICNAKARTLGKGDVLGLRRKY
nr:matrixin family metalloprotease [Streptomyces sp. BA2]